MKKIIGLGLAVIVIVYGCGLTGKETTPPASGLYIINASPDAPAFDVSLNNTLIASGYGYGKDSGYFFTPPGTYPLKVNQTGTTTNFLDNLVNFPGGKYYSLILLDSFSTYQLQFIEDKLNTDSSTAANIRLFDFCPNSPVTDAFFASTNKDTLVYRGRYFNDQASATSYRNFIPVEPGSYNLSLYEPDTTVLVKNFGSINFAAGKFYTVYLKGLYQNTTKPLDTAVIVH